MELPEIPGLYIRIIAIVVAGVGAVCDLRTRKIPNKLTFPAAGLGIILQSIYFASWSNSEDIGLRAAAGFIYGILGWISGVLIMSITKAVMRQFGQGDTKLMAALGTFLGPWLLLLVYFYYSLCFGFFTMFKLGLAVPWQDIWVASEMKKAGLSPVGPNLEKFQKARKETVPVAPFIALGTLLTVLLEGPSLAFFGFHD